MAKVGTNIII